ncbi:MAG: hypothetical protein AAB645_01060 [Patescibacteria group bacterium]
MTILKEEIMIRIRFIYLIRQAANSVLVKLAVIASLLGLVSLWVSVKNIYHNAPALSDLTGFLGYSTNAFLHTGLAVKVTVIALLYLGWLLGLDILKNNRRLISKIRLIKYQ